MMQVKMKVLVRGQNLKESGSQSNKISTDSLAYKNSFKRSSKEITSQTKERKRRTRQSRGSRKYDADADDNLQEMRNEA